MAQLTAADCCDKQSGWEVSKAHIQIKSIMQRHKYNVECLKVVIYQGLVVISHKSLSDRWCRTLVMLSDAVSLLSSLSFARGHYVAHLYSQS